MPPAAKRKVRTSVQKGPHEKTGPRGSGDPSGQHGASKGRRRDAPRVSQAGRTGGVRPGPTYFAVAFLAAAVTSAVAFLAAAVMSSETSLPAASISSIVSDCTFLAISA